MSERGLKSWTGSLSDGRVYRGGLYLFIDWLLGMVYFTLLTVGLALGVALLIVGVGIPILVLTLMGARYMAALDRQVARALLNVEVTPLQPGLDEDDLGLRERLSVLLKSAFTWQSMVYLFFKLFLGVFEITAWSMVLPFYLLELMVNMVGIKTGQITGRIMYGLGLALNTVAETMLAAPPDMEAEKAKREPDADEKPKRTIYDDDDGPEVDEDFIYFIGDDGEIESTRRYDD